MTLDEIDRLAAKLLLDLPGTFYPPRGMWRAVERECDPRHPDFVDDVLFPMVDELRLAFGDERVTAVGAEWTATGVRLTGYAVEPPRRIPVMLTV